MKTPEFGRFFPASLVHAESLPSIMEALRNEFTPEARERYALDARMDSFWPEAGSELSAYRPYVVANNVLRVPVRGVLLNNYSWATSYATGYQYIHEAMKRGMADPEVDGIALVINSGGGEVAGNFDLVDRIAAMRGVKPIRAFAAESAYSAAYNIAAAADSITVTRSGGVGSIGVLTMHVSVEKALEADGIDVTLIYAGKHKVDGNPFAALPEDVRDRIQSRVDGLYSEFVASVAKNRNLSEDAVRGTEALTYPAAEAVSIGLADSVGPLDVSMAAFEADVLQKRSAAMAEKDAAIEAAKLESFEEGRKAGAAAERTRIAAILGSEEAKGREQTALHIATKLDLDADAARSLLGTLPVATVAEPPKPGASAFEKAMNTSANPNVGQLPVATEAEEDPTGAKGTLSLIHSVQLPGFRRASK